MQSRIEELRRRRKELMGGGGPARTEKQHSAGKLTARERLALLFEPDTFQESHLFMRHRCTRFGMADKQLPSEAVVCGQGIVDARPVYAASQDFTVAGGSVGEGTANKIVAVMQEALKTGDPFVFINDGAGARIQEGVDSLSGLRADLLSECAAVGCRAANQRNRRPLRGRRRLFAGVDRLHHSGAYSRPDVHHRPQGDPAGHRRGNHR